MSVVVVTAAADDDVVRDGHPEPRADPIQTDGQLGDGENLMRQTKNQEMRVCLLSQKREGRSRSVRYVPKRAVRSNHPTKISNDALTDSRGIARRGTRSGRRRRESR